MQYKPRIVKKRFKNTMQNSQTLIESSFLKKSFKSAYNELLNTRISRLFS